MNPWKIWNALGGRRYAWLQVHGWLMFVALGGFGYLLFHQHINMVVYSLLNAVNLMFYAMHNVWWQQHIRK